ncbi:hypothetical protein pb186bvf_005556 [Paramecium bursaria]
MLTLEMQRPIPEDQPMFLSPPGSDLGSRQPRKSLRPVSRSDIHSRQTIRSATNATVVSCGLCNNSKSEMLARVCSCNERSYHLECIKKNLMLNYQLGSQVIRCATCGWFYPTIIKTKKNFDSLTIKEKIISSLLLIALISLIAIEINFLVKIKEPQTSFILILIAIILELFIMLAIITKIYRKILRVEFKLEPFSRHSNEKESRRNAFLILQAQKRGNLFPLEQDML